MRRSVACSRTDHLYLDHVGRDSFDGCLASQRGQLFRAEDFAALSCHDNGRASVPPSLLATALLLQTYEGVSDEEAKARADFDLRWKVALGIGLEDRPFAKSTLQLFRAHLILHDQVRAVFQRSLGFARRTGYLKGRTMRAVLDTSYILGRGAVKDTYNLLADGILQLVRALAGRAGEEPAAWAATHDLTRCLGTSLKGEAAIDWDDPAARQTFLSGVVADADRLLEMARAALREESTEDPERGRVRQAAELLAQLLLQDIDRSPAGPTLKQGVSPDRVASVHDPEIRHGRKSATKRFDGHKSAIAVDPDSQLITAVAVLPGNAQDHEQALDLVEQAEVNAEATVEETVGDCAYGDSETRRAFAGAGRQLVAKVPQRRGQAYFPKDDFRIDLETLTCTCPGGQATRTLVSVSSGDRYGAPGAPLRAFRFDAAVCAACPLRASCVRAKSGRGRLVMLHPEEALLQAARAFQRSDAFAPYRKLRQVAEHRLARLMQLGARQARYFGRSKTLCQLLLAATVANLTLVATKLGLVRGRRRSLCPLLDHVSGLLIHLFVTCWPWSAPALAGATPDYARTLGFRPRF